MLRILACADLHGRTERIARVSTLVTEYRPDIVVLPGDLTHAGTGQEAMDLLDLPIPVLAVPGNMDGPTEAARIRVRGRLDGPDPLIVGGVSFGGPAVTRTCDIAVTHEPPHGVLDAMPSGRHIGSAHVLDLMQRLRPRALVCGHVHESPGIATAEDTLVVNCTMGNGTTGGALIEIAADRVAARLV